ncbi:MULTISPECIES: hypothetical protein [Micromonospora]|uniref:hypothetical protein n=1 Tax=Micromonospora TaxID=1873 RepID=UPI0004C1E598|nr:MULTISPECIES: hypothetical protein [Micromonospora]MBC9001311.1 hypothetical protein [Micromonospora aurantiaca]MDG4756031.1 hypothetical protein [Micromonospora sp. WMMD718]
MPIKGLVAGVLVAWMLVATVGARYLSDRAFVLAVSAVMVVTLQVAQRPAVLLEVLRLGEWIGWRRAQASRRSLVDSPTVDLSQYRQQRQQDRRVHHGYN